MASHFHLICVASIYGNFLKIWRTQTGYNNASTQLHKEAIDEVHFSPDEQLVAFELMNRCQILDTTTGLSLFAFEDTTIRSIVFSQDSAFIGCLSGSRRLKKVQIWNAHRQVHGNG